MRITILGKSPAWQDAGGACSSYLVEQGGTAILIDCGNGAFGKLRHYFEYLDLDAVVISHLHADHYFDLVPFSFALTKSPRQQPDPTPPWPGTDQPVRPRAYGPPGGREAFRRLGGLVGYERLIEDAFEVSEYDPAELLSIGELNLRFGPVPHFIEAFAIEVTDKSGARFTYGTDCRPGPELPEFAAGTQLLFVEATVPRPEAGGTRGHLTPSEAAAIGASAAAERVVLTHISDEIDPGWVLSQARARYDGPVEIAAEGATFEL